MNENPEYEFIVSHPISLARASYYFVAAVFMVLPTTVAELKQLAKLSILAEWIRAGRENG